NKQQDIYQLSRTPRYINDPYPLSNSLQNINNKVSIGIIGSSLTAIDIALSLKNKNEVNSVTFLSRMHAYPRVRGIIKPHKLIHLTESNIKSIIKRNRLLTLRDLLKLFRKELIDIGYNWKFIFKKNQNHISL